MSKARFSVRAILWLILVVAAFLSGRASMQSEVNKLRDMTSSLQDQLAWQKSSLEEVLQLHRIGQHELEELRTRAKTQGFGESETAK